MDAYLMMCHQTIQSILKASRKRGLTKAETLMYNQLCEVLQKDGQVRQLQIEMHRQKLERDLDNEIASGEGEGKAK